MLPRASWRLYLAVDCARDRPADVSAVGDIPDETWTQCRDHLSGVRSCMMAQIAQFCAALRRQHVNISFWAPGWMASLGRALMWSSKLCVV